MQQLWERSLQVLPSQHTFSETLTFDKPISELMQEVGSVNRYPKNSVITDPYAPGLQGAEYKLVHVPKFARFCWEYTLARFSPEWEAFLRHHIKVLKNAKRKKKTVSHGSHILLSSPAVCPKEPYVTPKRALRHGKKSLKVLPKETC